MNRKPRPAHHRIQEFFETYTRDLKAEDLRRLFTRDTKEAYRFFARHVDVSSLEGLPWHRRLLAHMRLLFRLSEGGVALGLFEHSTYVTGRTVLQLDQLLAIYSDGITEAENPAGRPFDEQGLESALLANRGESVSAIGAAIVHTVEQYTADTRLADDLTVLLLRRCAVAGLL